MDPNSEDQKSGSGSGTIVCRREDEKIVNASRTSVILLFYSMIYIQEYFSGNFRAFDGKWMGF
jgi:hypothetical protein